MNRWDTSVVAPWAAITGKPTTLAGYGVDAEGDARWKTLANIITPTLLNSWTNAGGGRLGAGYYKTPQGEVVIVGTILNGAAPTAFVLPVGYRPLTQLNFGTWSTGAEKEVDVNTNGNVDVYNNVAGNYRSLNSISFRTDA